MPGPHHKHWSLDPKIRFLNHGSFGATPVQVLKLQAQFARRMEKEPVLFLAREFPELLDEARNELATFLSVSGEDLAFVTNATEGINTVLRSLSFSPGDELLVTTHEYQASRNALEFVAARSGARVVQVDLPFPVPNESAVLDAVLSRVTPKTRLALIDHVTSQTGLILPVKKIVSALSVHGVESLIDGAHAPGMLDLDIGGLGATYYAGNCHKWLCAPKTAAFLWVREDKKPDIHPLSISHGASWPTTEKSRFRLEFDWTGTMDPCPILCVAESIRTMESMLPGGFPQVREQNRSLALKARDHLAGVLGVTDLSPASMIGSLASLPLPDPIDSFPSPPQNIDPLQLELFEKDRIEVPIIGWPKKPKRLIRISAQLYNSFEEYEALGESLTKRLGL